MIGGDVGRFFESINDSSCVGTGVFPPLPNTALRGVNPDDTTLAGPMLVKDLGNPASHFDCVQKLFLLFIRAHGGISNRTRPYRGNERTDIETLPGNQIRDPLKLILTCFRIGMREKKEIVDAIELSTVHLGSSREIEHVLKIYIRFVSTLTGFANETRPHCIVKFKGREAHGN